MTGEESDEIHFRKLAEHLRENGQPLCPQFHVCQMERLYPVRGYCVLAQSPGWFMVPSIEEYREYCTTSRFGECCWFKRPQDNTESAEWGTRENPGREGMQSLGRVGPPLDGVRHSITQADAIRTRERNRVRNGR